MSRLLLAVPPLAGHLNPAAALAGELARRGHEVSWVGSEAALRPVLGPDAVVHPTGSRILRGQGGHGAAAVASLWERFLVPYTRFTLPAVERAVRAARPELLLVDQQMLAGALVAQRHGLPWVSLVASSMELARPFRELPAVEAEIDGHLATLWRAAGLPPGDRLDIRFSPYLVVACTTPALTAQAQVPPPADVAFVGPLLGRRPPVPGFGPDRLDRSRPAVLVSTGTLAEDVGTDFHRRAVEALRLLGGRVTGVVVAPPESVPDPPPHVLVAPRVPVLELMPRLAAVLTHGGLNTVCEALAHGVPLVVAPIRHDQPINAGDVVRAGAGVRVSFARADPGRLARALAAVLDDPGYRAAAGRVRDSFAAAGGVGAAADRIERLVQAGPKGQQPLSAGTPRS